MMLKLKIKNSLLFLLLLLPLLQFGQETKTGFKSELLSDLPDETESTEPLSRKQWQLESGYLYDKFSDGESAGILQGLLRHGLSRGLEIRAIFEEGKQRDRYMDETVQSTSPLALGLKWAILNDKEIIPDVSLVAYVKLPFTSHKKEQEAYWSPIFIAAFQNKFGEKLKLNYNVGLQQEAYSADWLRLLNATVSYEFNNRLQVFTEYFAQFSNEEAMHNAGMGLTLRFTEGFAVYLAAGSSFASQQSNQFASTGLVWTFLK